jgi:hypothetical protein
MPTRVDPAAFGLATLLFFVILSRFPKTNWTEADSFTLRVAGSVDALSSQVRFGWLNRDR